MVSIYQGAILRFSIKPLKAKLLAGEQKATEPGIIFDTQGMV